jgi:hypothetical protein
MLKRLAIAGLSCLMSISALAQEHPQPARPTNDALTDAAIIALIIAASVAAHKAMGKPCACPDDRMSNGRRCNSAWSRHGGFRPLCVPSDVTPEMIRVYRATKGVPPLK